jgi:hypothetical protein
MKPSLNLNNADTSTASSKAASNTVLKQLYFVWRNSPRTSGAKYENHGLPCSALLHVSTGQFYPELFWIVSGEPEFRLHQNVLNVL